MCTVTFVPCNNGYFLGSNRDEKWSRNIAVPPVQYQIEKTNYIFPKDPDSNGTWIVLKENGDALCLLNGAFDPILEKSTYKKSRGKVVLTIAVSTHMLATFLSEPLYETAPFTLIIVCNLKLFECRWDGSSKHHKLLDSSQAHIWSSATLYNKNQQQMREQWFNNWLLQHPIISFQQLHLFHKNTGIGNPAVDLVMNRNGKLFTVSIAVIMVSPTLHLMQYMDLNDKRIYKNWFLNP